MLIEYASFYRIFRVLVYYCAISMLLGSINDLDHFDKVLLAASMTNDASYL